MMTTKLTKGCITKSMAQFRSKPWPENIMDCVIDLYFETDEDIAAYVATVDPEYFINKKNNPVLDKQYCWDYLYDLLRPAQEAAFGRLNPLTASTMQRDIVNGRWHIHSKVKELQEKFEIPKDVVLAEEYAGIQSVFQYMKKPLDKKMKESKEK